MGGAKVIPFLPRETSEADPVATAEKVAPHDRLLAARTALVRIDRRAGDRRAVLTYVLRLLELHAATLGDPPAGGDTRELLHDAQECPARSRSIRARAVLRSLSEEGEAPPQAPKLALTYVRRLLDLELAEAR
jgi:hypothetical protein